MCEKLTEQELLTKMVLTVISTGKIVDKAASWSMVGVGATLIMIFANINNILMVYNSFELRVIIGGLLLALVFGGMQKMAFVLNSQGIEILSKLNKYFYENNSKIDDTDLTVVMAIMNKKIARFYQRRKIKRYSDPKAVRDHYFLIDIGKRYNFQVECAIFLALTIGLTIGWAALNFKYFLLI